MGGRPGSSAGLASLSAFLRLIRFSHTLFSLPWALAGLFIGSGGLPRARVLLWVVVAMAGARTAAMTFNRLADRRLDAANPRTRARPSVTGEVGAPAMVAALVVSAAVFVLAARMLNPLCFQLSLPALAVLLGYSLCKRFTSFSHLVLGLSLGLSPVGACLAARGAFDSATGTAALLGLAVLAWTAGFDILYAMQDETHDRESGLHSMPARLGAAGALVLARVLHGAVPPVLVLAGLAGGLGAIYYGGVAVSALLLVLEHRLANPADPARLNAAFFGVNVAIALIMMTAVLLDLLLLAPHA